MLALSLSAAMQEAQHGFARQSGSMAPALQSHAPYPLPQTAHTAVRMTFPQRRDAF